MLSGSRILYMNFKISGSSHYCAAIIALLALALTGCGESDPVGSNGGNNIPDYYRIETEPSISADRNYIYYVAIDTTSLNKDGIWRAKRKNPVRETVLLEDNLHSPCAAFDNKTIAYLKNSKIHYYRISDSSSWQSGIQQNFESIVYINDTLLLGCRQGSIYTINESADEVTYLVPGRNPTLYNRDTFVYIGQLNHQGLIIDQVMRTTITPDVVEIIYEIGNLPWGQTSHWPSMEHLRNRLTYTISGAAGNLVYAAEIDDGSSRVIDTSLYDKSYIIDYDRIIFTGKDGRFYQSNFQGTIKMPYWGWYGP